jgi:hypothetical protein
LYAFRGTFGAKPDEQEANRARRWSGEQKCCGTTIFRRFHGVQFVWQTGDGADSHRHRAIFSKAVLHQREHGFANERNMDHGGVRSAGVLLRPVKKNGSAKSSAKQRTEDVFPRLAQVHDRDQREKNIRDNEEECALSESPQKCNRQTRRTEKPKGPPVKRLTLME